jgi:hypothetical protein
LSDGTSNKTNCMKLETQPIYKLKNMFKSLFYFYDFYEFIMKLIVKIVKRSLHVFNIPYIFVSKSILSIPVFKKLKQILINNV